MWRERAMGDLIATTCQWGAHLLRLGGPTQCHPEKGFEINRTSRRDKLSARARGQGLWTMIFVCAMCGFGLPKVG
jgi:hypothetical protein